RVFLGEAAGAVGDLQGSGELENLDWIPIADTRQFELANVTRNVLVYAEELIRTPSRQTASRKIPFFKHVGDGKHELIFQ
ncbi:MAG: hypothetical protein RIM80_17115, partial [Alphaproteobacteria bacterium]